MAVPCAPTPVPSELDAHEVVQAFLRVGLPLSRTLCDMLNERLEHRTERRGSGFTQSTRLMANPINHVGACRESLLPLFDRPALDRLDQLGPAGAAQVLRAELASMLTRYESRLLTQMLLQCLFRDGVEPPLAPVTLEKIPIGTCPLAEEYFLEIAYGKVRRGGSVNVVINAAGRPVLLEKCGLGESHSCISVAGFSINGVDIVPGSLVAVAREEAIVETAPRTSSGRGHVIRGHDLAGLRFLRLTTLAVPPEDRKRAFSTHFEQQIRAGLFSPESTTIQQLMTYAEEQVR